MNKTEQAIRADERVADAWSEGSPAAGGDGVWVCLKEGYITDTTGTGTIHEDTWTKCLAVLRKVRKMTDKERAAAGH